MNNSNIFDDYRESKEKKERLYGGRYVNVFEEIDFSALRKSPDDNSNQEVEIEKQMDEALQSLFEK